MRGTLLRQAVRLARRELRGGIGGLGVLVGCLVIGVGAIAGIGSLAASLGAGIKDNARELLGGDVEVRIAYHPADPEQQQLLADSGRLSQTVSMRAMARATNGDRLSLIELKAVDAAYPLYGAVALSPPQPLGAVLAEVHGTFGAAVDPALLGRLGVKIGDAIKIGEAVVQVRAVIEREPDAAASGLIFGPRVLISTAALPATRLIQPGALVSYRYRLRLPASEAPDAWANQARIAFPDAGWEIRSFDQASPDLRRLLDRVGQFLSLVGLSALLVGGVGIANAVRGHIAAKTETIATLKCLGAPSRLVFSTYLCEILVLAITAISAALALGAVLPVAVAPLLKHLLPVSAKPGIYPHPLILAALYGLLTTLVFSLWPLAAIYRIPAGSLFRDVVDRARRRAPRSAVALTALLVGCLAAVVLVGAQDRQVAMWFVAGAIGAFALFWGAGAAVMLGASKLARPRRLPLRLGAGKSAPARRADRADRIVVGDRADRAGGGGAGSGQSRASDRREDARRGAGLLFYRHPAGPARRFRGHRARRPGRAYATSADDARPNYKAERRSGRASAGCARGSLGVAQRPRPDLFRSTAKRFRTRRGSMVATRLSGAAADIVRCRSGARYGPQDRRHPDRESARPRDHRAHCQSQNDQLGAAGDQFRDRVCAGHSRTCAPDRSCRRLSAAARGGSRGPPGHRSVPERLGDPCS